MIRGRTHRAAHAPGSAPWETTAARNLLYVVQHLLMLPTSRNQRCAGSPRSCGRGVERLVSGGRVEMRFASLSGSPRAGGLVSLALDHGSSVLPAPTLSPGPQHTFSVIYSFLSGVHSV